MPSLHARVNNQKLSSAAHIPHRPLTGPTLLKLFSRFIGCQLNCGLILGLFYNFYGLTWSGPHLYFAAFVSLCSKH